MLPDTKKDIRTFSVAPDIIYSLIKAQAGTLAKAVLECVMNSIDAGASNIKITINQHDLKIIDDGPGFKTKAEIEQCFEVFGFDHQDSTRVYGQFGIGRAQLWNYCLTEWRTNTFKMNVDIKNRGLDYDLFQGLSLDNGLVIQGVFYEPLSATDLLSFEKEFQELCCYSQIPVFLNGIKINKDPLKETWTHETKDAWIKIKNSGDLYVYNLGVLVRRYPGHTVGCGGEVVTKPGIKLALNMARNDILTSECKVWKRLRPYLQRQVDNKNRKSNFDIRLSTVTIENIINRFIAGDLDYQTFANANVIKDVFNKYHSMQEIGYYTISDNKPDPISIAEPGSMLAERIHKAKRGVILHSEVLERFGVNTVKAFTDKFLKSTKLIQSRYFKDYYENDCYENSKMCPIENYQDICPELSSKCELVLSEEWSTDERIALLSLEHVNRFVIGLLRRIKVCHRENWCRSLEVGISDSCRAWTDGEKYISFERKNLVQLAKKGLSGWQVLINILIHEYLHEKPSSGTHAHDDNFFQRFHESMMYLDEANQELLQRAYQRYIVLRRKNKLSLTKKSTLSFDLLDTEIV